MPVIEFWRQAVAALDQGNVSAAESACDALMAAGAKGEGLYLLALLRSAQGLAAEALRLLEQADAVNPGHPDIAYNMGILLRDLGRAEDAAAAWLRTVALVSDHRDAWLNLAAILEDMSGKGPALRVFTQALAECPDDAALLFAKAEMLQRQGMDRDALDAYDQLVARHPDHVLGRANRGVVLARLGEAAGAEAALREAVSLGEADGDEAVQAKIHFKLANLLLGQGRWAEGFAEYEWRRRLPEAPVLDWPMPEWTGTEPAGCRVLLWNDQGLGDAIQFLRFVPQAAARGHEVVVAVRGELVGLAATVAGVATVISLDDAVPPVDAHAPLSSLPHKLGVGDGPVWPGAPYVSAGGRLVSLPPVQGKRVGLVWAGNAQYDHDRHRSMGLADLAPLMALAGIHWHSLQLGAGSAQLADSPWADRITDLAPLIHDFQDSAAILGQMDLLMTVDTAAAHLAGALGRPAWVLLPSVGMDGRWGISGDATPWYPSLRLFRQTRAGDWATVMEQVGATL